MSTADDLKWELKFHTGDPSGFAYVTLHLVGPPGEEVSTMETWQAELAELQRIKKEAARAAEDEAERGELLAGAYFHAHAAKTKLDAALATDITPEARVFLRELLVDVLNAMMRLVELAEQSPFATQKPILGMHRVLDHDPTLSGGSH
jgi:hypothetical protein